ncbi:rhodanese-like domain-containing protein [Psychrobacillus sp. NEAU-3TGS]|uniref:sulfurtransferase n=1 Tax=Psychrobacillus sp. NEAU-3TGS TaxID=2995412 RepID=UPI0024970659|nr:rhodanese-like domain-containing protein [Psychrobacillus sp. NEAU-3TGS]MDI2589536.1 rhodanese-like domain-containing protein [Psychrobacillus sp. NEAU-3TGS]
MTNVFINWEDVQPEKVRFIDTRFDLANKTAGPNMYKEGHLEGAIYWDLEQDLSDMTSNKGRHPMISKDKMTELCRQAGLQLDDAIIVYDQGASPFALRAYFLLEWAGFTNVYVLREGYEAVKGLFPISKEEPEISLSDTEPNWNDAIYLDVEDVKKVVAGELEGQLVDARAAFRFKGESEPIDPIAGHIPTAVNFDWEQLKEGGKFLEKEMLAEQMQHVTDKNKPVIAYCGSGVTAAPLYAGLKEAGYSNVKLYVGSYSDWIRENEVEQD